MAVLAAGGGGRPRGPQTGSNLQLCPPFHSGGADPSGCGPGTRFVDPGIAGRGTAGNASRPADQKPHEILSGVPAGARPSSRNASGDPMAPRAGCRVVQYKLAAIGIDWYR